MKVLKFGGTSVGSAQRIMSQGYLVEVLAPESLKERVKNVLLKMNEIYGL